MWNCPIGVQQRRIEDGATNVDLIRPGIEIPDLEAKLVKLIHTCILNVAVTTIELQVCVGSHDPALQDGSMCASDC